MHLVVMKYYSITIKLYDKRERAVIVKATSIHDAEKLASKWVGTVMNVVEVLVNPNILDALKRG